MAVMGANDSTTRFSDRVAHYVFARPGYPIALLEFCRRKLGLEAGQVVADVGSGTGILTQLFLENGNAVFGVEPNREMRQAGEAFLAKYARFHSVEGTAESTTLEDRSVDFVVAGQAFHWFDVGRARREFARIVRPGGWALLIWNDRRVMGSKFAEQYERLLRTWSNDYEKVSSKWTTSAGGAVLDELFGAGGHRVVSFDNEQVLDFEGLMGRILSSSYMPLAGDARHQGMLEEARRML